MTDSDTAPEGSGGRDPAGPPQAGVLGNLPRTRPAVRSPRRAEAPDPESDAARATASSRPRATHSEASAEAEDAPGAGEIESLARSGIAVATGAATLGLRIAGRAASAVRDAVERR